MFYKCQPIHITLDGGATSNYIKRIICEKFGFKIYPNGQTSLLGDKKTRLPSLGEIDVTLTRDTWTVRLRALVVENLGADVFGGTVFLHDNDIATRQKKKEITLSKVTKNYSVNISQNVTFHGYKNKKNRPK